jgi:hypothetical protein
MRPRSVARRLSIRPQESEQAVAEINESPYFYGLNWIINTPDKFGILIESLCICQHPFFYE